MSSFAPYTYINATSVAGSSTALASVATLSVALRFISRYHSKKGYGLDDWLSLPALVFTWGMAGVMVHGSITGSIGGHSYPEEFLDSATMSAAYEQYYGQLKLDYALFVLSCLALGFIRLTVLFLYRRVFDGPVFRAINWLMIGLATIWAIGYTTANATVCAGHPAAYWNLDDPNNAACTSVTPIQTSMVISDIILDVLIIILPIYPIMKLQMRPSRKAAIMFVFLLGLFATACAIVRAVLQVSFFERRYGVFHLPWTDSLGIMSTLEFWIMLETGVACVTCNLTAVPGAFKSETWQKLRSWTKSSRGYLQQKFEGKREPSIDSEELKPMPVARVMQV